MDIKKLYYRLFYLNTRAVNSWQATNLLSISEAFLLLVFCAILRKELLPDLKVTLPFVFISFLVVSLIIRHFNNNFFDRRNTEFIEQWKIETKRNKILYRICNTLFIIFVFSMFYILSLFD